MLKNLFLGKSVSPEMRQSFIKRVKLILHFTKKHERDPRLHLEIAFGVTTKNLEVHLPFVLDSKDKNV